MPIEGPSILVDPERYVDCHTCRLACAVAHTGADSVIGAVLSGERLQTSRQWIEEAITQARRIAP